MNKRTLNEKELQQWRVQVSKSKYGKENYEYNFENHEQHYHYENTNLTRQKMRWLTAIDY